MLRCQCWCSPRSAGLAVAREFPFCFLLVCFALWLLRLILCCCRPPTELDDRLSITLTLMLTAVAQKFAGSAGLPKISYLTLLDK